MEYTKQCPSCKDTLVYTKRYLYNRSIREHRRCRSCASKKVNDWKRITSLTRKCPACNSVLEYSVYHTWWWANKRNQVCRTCSHTGKQLSEITKEKISAAISGNNNPMFGRRHTDIVKKFISTNNRGNKSKSGQTCSENDKMNMRNAAIKRIKIQGTSRSYNPMACVYMDSLKPTFDFIHAKSPSGEYRFRGYFADGYDAANNVWFEYDEPHHFRADGTLRLKDAVRMSEIMRHLGCRFVRYNDRTKNLVEHFADGSQKHLTFPE